VRKAIRRAVTGLALSSILVGAAGARGQRASDDPRAIFDRAIEDFRGGRVEESANGFDALAKMRPDAAPELWQRGIAQYLVGRFKECRAQFEAHRTVNPDDVENAAWHFLCVARAESPDKARAALLPVGQDDRVPMTQIYEMFRGKLTPDAVLAAAARETSAQFYAQLYVGLYFEALGNARQALEHITIAAADRYAEVGGYMNTVAKVHRNILQSRR
jgi:lipoprotein NlpI